MTRPSRIEQAARALVEEYGRSKAMTAQVMRLEGKITGAAQAVMLDYDPPAIRALRAQLTSLESRAVKAEGERDEAFRDYTRLREGSTVDQALAAELIKQRDASHARAERLSVASCEMDRLRLAAEASLAEAVGALRELAVRVQNYGPSPVMPEGEALYEALTRAAGLLKRARVGGAGEGGT
jgi:hypothetical protein